MTIDKWLQFPHLLSSYKLYLRAYVSFCRICLCTEFHERIKETQEKKDYRCSSLSMWYSLWEREITRKRKKDLQNKKNMLANTYRVAINCAWVHMFGFAVLLQQHSQKHVCAQILRPLTPLYYIPTCQRPLTPLICWTHQTTS